MIFSPSLLLGFFCYFGRLNSSSLIGNEISSLERNFGVLNTEIQVSSLHSDQYGDDIEAASETQGLLPQNDETHALFFLNGARENILPFGTNDAVSDSSTNDAVSDSSSIPLLTDQDQWEVMETGSFIPAEENQIQRIIPDYYYLGQLAWGLIVMEISSFFGMSINRPDILIIYGVFAFVFVLLYSGHFFFIYCDGTFPIKLEKLAIDANSLVATEVSFERWAAMPLAWITTSICFLPNQTYKDIFPNFLNRSVFITILVIQLMHILGVFDLFSYLARYICRVPQNNL